MMRRFFLLLLAGGMLFGHGLAQDRSWVDSLENVLSSSTSSDSLKAKVLFKLTWHHLRYDVPKSREFATQALQLSRQLGDSIGIHRVYHYWGLIHRLESRYDSSLYYFQKLVDFNTRRGAEDKSLQSLFNMGVVSSFQGFYDQSLQYYLRALRIAEKIGDDYMKAEALNSMGIIHKKLKNYDQAIQMTAEALSLARAGGDSIQQAIYLGNLGSLSAEQEQYDSALSYYQQALTIDSTEGVLWGVGHQLNNIGSVYLSLGDFDRAEGYLERSLAVREALDQPKEIAESLVQMATLRNRQNEPEPAEGYAQRAVSIAEAIGDRPLLRDGYQCLAEAYAQQQHYHNAYHYRTAYAALQDSLLSETTTEQINTLQIRYETEKKEKEIALLTSERELQEARIRGLILVAVLAGLVIILLFLFFRARMRHQKQVQAQQEALHWQEVRELEQKQKMLAMESMLSGQEAERKRIAKDLHDGLGNLLANVQMQFSTVEEDMPKGKLPVYQDTYRLLGEACGEVRKIAHNMMPGALTRFGLVAALQEMGNALEKSGQMEVDIQVYGLEERLPEKVEVSLYRIVQELLNNVVKHAQATSVIIQLNRQGEELNLLVEDNGLGFDPQEARGGLGLESLQSRVRYLDGSLEVDTALGRGTATMVHVPLEKTRDQRREARV